MPPAPPDPFQPPKKRALLYQEGDLSVRLWFPDPGDLHRQYLTFQAMDTRYEAEHPNETSKSAAANREYVQQIFGNATDRVLAGEAVPEAELLKELLAPLVVDRVKNRVDTYHLPMPADILIGTDNRIGHLDDGRSVLQAERSLIQSRFDVIEMDESLFGLSLRRNEESIFIEGTQTKADIKTIAEHVAQLKDGVLSQASITQRFGSVEALIARMERVAQWYEEGLADFHRLAGPVQIGPDRLLERLEAQPGHLEQLTEAGIALHRRIATYLPLDSGRDWIPVAAAPQNAVPTPAQLQKLEKLHAHFSEGPNALVAGYARLQRDWADLLDTKIHRPIDMELEKTGSWVPDARSLLIDRVAPSVITYAFGVPASVKNASECVNLNELGRARFREALKEFSSAYSIKFIEVTNVETARFQIYTEPNGYVGHAFYPDRLHQPLQLGPRISEQTIDSNDIINTRNHELGHTLGLPHTHATPKSDPADKLSLSPALDKRRKSMMSYNGAAQESPARLDYAALSKKYIGKLVNELNTHYELYPAAEGVDRTVLDTGGDMNVVDGRRLEIGLQLDLRDRLESSSLADGHFLSFAEGTKIQGAIGSPKDDEFVVGATPATLFGGQGRDIFILAREASTAKIGDFSREDKLDLGTHRGATAMVERLKDGARITLSDGTGLEVKCEPGGFGKLMHDLRASGLKLEKQNHRQETGFAELTVDSLINQTQEIARMRKGDPTRVNNAAPKGPAK